jgi:hypothetical protein
MKSSSAAHTSRKATSAATTKKNAPLINYAALLWLKQRSKKPKTNDEALWKEFDKVLNANRLNLRKRK